MMLVRSRRIAVFVASAAFALSACISDRTTSAPIDLAGCNVQLPSEAFGSTLVIIRDFAFTPAQVNIRPGTKVTWVNCEPVGRDSHTSTSDSPGWSSPLMASGTTFTHEFSAAGTFQYHCVPHPNMIASVVVN